MKVYFKKCRDAARIPQKATPQSAGLDLCACIQSDVTLLPNQSLPIPTGLMTAIPEGFGGFIFARSGLATKFRMVPANCVGVIDSDYRGEIMVVLSNQGGRTVVITPNMRIAQLVIMPVPEVEITEAEELPETVRGAGGFGSTGV